jgi:hypothetical protein
MAGFQMSTEAKKAAGKLKADRADKNTALVAMLKRGTAFTIMPIRLEQIRTSRVGCIWLHLNSTFRVEISCSI